jgi:N-6 DNA Methylase
LQPTGERRRTGSHYTPRSLTAPIVKHALDPAFARLGADAMPEQILELKVCDPAMGSGAFLVEAAAPLANGWSRPGRAGLPVGLKSRRMRICTPAGSWRSAAFTASIRTRVQSIWQNCRCGWRRWRATMNLPSSITH